MNHQIQHNLNLQRNATVLDRCLSKGFTSYVNLLYWKTIEKKDTYSIANTLYYSEDELIAAESNWRLILQNFENDYKSTLPEHINKYGMRTSRISENLPGAIGYCIGYKIIDNYVEIYGPESWRDIYTLDPREVLEKSGILRN